MFLSRIKMFKMLLRQCTVHGFYAIQQLAEFVKRFTQNRPESRNSPIKTEVMVQVKSPAEA